jgi:hypothetical protein
VNSLPRSGENSALLPHFAGLWKPTLVPDESFQTVSEEFFSETGVASWHHAHVFRYSF